MEHVEPLICTNILAVQQPKLLEQCRAFGIDKVAVAVEKCDMLCKRERWDRLHTTAAKLVTTLKDTRQTLPREGAFWPRAMSVAIAHQALAAAHNDQWAQVARYADLAFVVGGPQEFTEVAELAVGLAKANQQAPDTSAQGQEEDGRSVQKLPLLSSATPDVDLQRPIKRIPAADVEQHLATDPKTPAIVEGLQDDWLASTRWADAGYMADKYGLRSVPLELGTWPNLREDMMTLQEFFQRYFTFEHQAEAPSPQAERAADTGDGQDGKPSQRKDAVAYLAQHNLLQQIPALQEDVSVPSVCSTHDRSLHEASVWWGSKGTVTPIHFDSFPNLLAQVVGYKYVRLFAPSQSDRLYPFGANSGKEDDQVQSTQQEGQHAHQARKAAVEAGRYASQGNISQVPDPRSVDLKRFPAMEEAVYEEAVLGPGDTLYLPRSHWHFITSLSPSMSVNFWWKEGGR